MAEPTSSLSYYDLILRVAEAAGVAYYGSDGQGRACIPIDVYNIEKCKRVVNDGIKMFISSAPRNGWNWMKRIASVTFATVETTGTVDSGSSTTLVDDALEDTYDTDDEINGYYVYDLTQEIYAEVQDYTASGGTVTVTEWLDYQDRVSSLTPAADDDYSITNLKTVEGDKARYFLPDDFQGEVGGKITYAKDSNRGHIIDWIGEETFRTYREVVITSSYPTKAAVRPYHNRKWELVVDPSPTAADIVIFPYRVGFDELQIETGDINTPAATYIVDDSIGALWPDDYFNNWTIHIMAGTGRGSYATVTDYTGASGKFTVAKWLAADGTSTGTTPNSSSTYYVEPEANKHPAGMQFDSAIVSACLAQAEFQFEDLNLGYMNKFLQKDLPDAHAIDARSGPKKLGRMLPGTGVRIIERERVWTDVEYE